MLEDPDVGVSGAGDFDLGEEGAEVGVGCAEHLEVAVVEVGEELDVDVGGEEHERRAVMG